MEIFFGLAFDEAPLPAPPAPSTGIQYLGPVGLLHFLESRLGLIGLPANNEFIRIEQYRQLLKQHLEVAESPFFRASFEADQLATAEALLERRDELLLAGWDFTNNDKEDRLNCLAKLEAAISSGKHKLEAGFADRFTQVLKYLVIRRPDLKKLTVHEPSDILPRHFQRLFEALSQKGVTIAYLPPPEAEKNTDLGHFQSVLQGTTASKQRKSLKADGSLLIIRGKRETAMATFFAQLLRHNRDYRPSCLIPEKNNTLDHALTLEGLPSLGMLSASLARPTLQVLKLVTVFFWEPIDPFKIMEFVSLAEKPLDRELSNRIANQMAQAPGLDSDAWRATIARFFSEARESAAKGSKIKLEEIEYQYNFWFKRRRYAMSETVPKEEVIDMFAYLAKWAYQSFEDNESKNTSLLVLGEQAKRVKALLEELPEYSLSHLELERIVRTIYEPAPMQLRDCQVGHLPYTTQAAGIYGATENLVWWNFAQSEPQHFFSRWYGTERKYLEEQGVFLEAPEEENRRMLWHRKRPFLHTKSSLLLLIPEMINGQSTTSHPLLGDLQAAFGNLDAITMNHTDIKQPPQIIKELWNLPEQIKLEKRQLGAPRPFIEISGIHQLEEREEESFSSLNDLFYYPYQWVFKHKVRFRKSSILSLVSDNTLRGNLAHSMFERLLSQDGIHQWKKEDVEAFIDAEKMDLFAKEGAVMLMYGKEPERIGFVQRLKFSAWSLVRHIRENGWQVEGIEMPVEGAFGHKIIRGRADLILKRGEEKAIVDLKWRGARYREEMIRNEEDLQLVLYAHMLDERPHQWATTAYYIIEKGLMLSRHNDAFQDISPISPDSELREINQRIFEKMKATFKWRMDQIGRGQVEIRCAETESELEEHYREDNLFDFLEMKSGDAAFDDYRTLINLIK